MGYCFYPARHCDDCDDGNDDGYLDLDLDDGVVGCGYIAWVTVKDETKLEGPSVAHGDGDAETFVICSRVGVEEGKGRRAVVMQSWHLFATRLQTGKMRDAYGGTRTKTAR